MARAKEVPPSGLDAALDIFRRPLPGAESNPVVRWIDWILRGVGQVVFQGNWMTGILILIGIAVNSRVYLVAALLGTFVSTLTAVLLKVDRGLLNAGLLGFNGCLLGIGLNAYMSQDFTGGNWGNPLLYIYIIAGAAFTTVIFAALGSLLGSREVPALTAPFVFAAWFFIFAVHKFAGMTPGPLLKPGLTEAVTQAGPYVLDTYWIGTLKGVGEIFFQDNWITGLIFIVAIAINSRLSALMGLGGALVGVLVAVAYGAPEAAIRDGLFGFNAALTAMALGGVFFVLNGAGFLYALFGTIVTSWAWASIANLLAPMGMPTFTSAFVLVGWLFIIAKPGFPAVVPVPPGESTYPEDNGRRWRALRRV